MSKHNYNQYSSNKKNKPAAEVENVEAVVAVDEVEKSVEVKMEVEQVKEAASAVELVKETVETKSLPKTVIGTVANCAKLNIRSTPISTADIVTVLSAGTEVEINVKRSTNSWLKITTAAGIEGYCMRQFVNATL